MINQDRDYLEKRWREWWNRENEDRPLISVFALKRGAKPFEDRYGGTLAEKWQDEEYVLKREIHAFENTFFGGEAFPAFNPNLGPDIYGAVWGGCGIEFGETTSWSLHRDAAEIERGMRFAFDNTNRWWQKIVSMTRAALAEANGRYLVGVTDIHTGMDALTSLYGPDTVCMAMYDAPEAVQDLLKQSREASSRIFAESFALTRGTQQGTTNWMQIWHPDAEWYVTSCDFSCLISAGDFEEYVAPTVEHELNMLGASVYHLDGVAALRHLDRLLRFERLNGIQWVYGAGQPTARAWKEVLQKIQRAGKNIQIQVVPSDVEEVCSFLRPEGVHFTCWVESEEEAKRVLETAQKSCLRKITPVGVDLP